MPISIEKIETLTDTKGSSIALKHPNDLAFDNDGNLWVATDNLYSVHHYHFEDTLDFGTWSNKRYYYFQICWDSTIVASPAIKKKYGKWQYILNNNSSGGSQFPFSYQAKVRTVSKTVTLDSMWDVDTTTSPLFAWGRSGTIDQKSGWSFEQFNWQTGWSRVTSTTGGNSLNEGIFHSQSLTFTIQTAQYDVWAWVDSVHDYTNHIGHVPDDSMMGVNFSVFGRRNLAYNAVKSVHSSGNETLAVLVNPTGDRLISTFFTEEDIEHPKIEVFDILGRLISSSVEGYAQRGWNTITIPINKLTSGTYICRVSGSGFTQSRTIQISW